MKRLLLLCLLALISSAAFAYPYVKCGDGKMWPERIRNSRGVICESYGPYRYASGNTCVLNMRVCKALRP
jgi:hypothetical protein